MSQQFVLSCKKDIKFTEHPEVQELILSSKHQQLTFKPVQPGLKQAIKSLTNGGSTLETLTNWVQSDPGLFPAFKLYNYLQKLTTMGWLCHSVVAGGRIIAKALPMTANFHFPNIEVEDKSSYVLSRFAYIRCVDEQMILESPLSRAQVHLIDPNVSAIVSHLAKPCKYEQLKNLTAIISPKALKSLVSLLLSTRMVFSVNEDGKIPEQDSINLNQWEFHDLLFHTRSRAGRHSNPTGRTYRFKGKIDPLPAIKPQMSSETVSLYRPDLETLQITDISFSQVLENRKSIREYGENPITAGQLGEFLYRSARIKHNTQTELGELTSRPYPSAGALYELELYPAIDNCQGIRSGLYHYQPQNHELGKLVDKEDLVEDLLRGAGLSMGKSNKPQVLIIIAARFQRLAWKYESIAYALMLKDLGALYQTMYLVATAMNLASCGIGTGNSDLFSQATEIDYYTETSVGEFAIGSRK